MRCGRPTAALLGLALAGTLLAGCSSSGDTAPEPQPSKPKAQLHVEVDQRVDLGEDGAPLSLDSGAVTSTTSSRPDGLDDTVVLYELASGKRSKVARSAFPRGFINWAVSAGDWTVYVDQSDEQGDRAPEVLWRVRAVSRSTQETRTLDTNHDKPDAFVPRVFSKDGFVFWSSAEKDRSARETLWRPEWPRPRYVLRHADFAPTTESISDGWMYYQAPPDAPTQDEQASDCWRVRLDGSGAEQLTDSGFVMSCSADGERLVWMAHIDPEAPAPADVEISDDPYELWTQEAGGEPQLLHRGYFTYSWPVVVGDLVIWQREDKVTLTDLAEPATSLVFPGTGSVESALYDGTTLALLTTKGSHVVANVVNLDELRQRS